MHRGKEKELTPSLNGSTESFGRGRERRWLAEITNNYINETGFLTEYEQVTWERDYKDSESELNFDAKDGAAERISSEAKLRRRNPSP